MQCFNCRNEYNGVASVCPYCHTHPRILGSQPYSGIDPANDQSMTITPGGAMLFLVLIGIFFAFTFPPASLVCWVIGVIAFIIGKKNGTI
jgi:hypothetical protein